MKKVFIHLGLPKTGSSYLQYTFANNSIMYSQHGLIYKDFANNFKDTIKNRLTNGNGGKIANSLRTNFSLLNKSDNALKAKQDIKKKNLHILDDFFSTLDNNENYNHLISSEAFSECTPDSLNYILNIINKNFKCVFVAFVRNPVDLIISLYNQRLKHERYTESFNVYYPSAILFVKKIFSLLIGLRQNIIVFNYDVKKHNLINCFENLIFSKLISTEPKKIVNPSPNYHQSEIIRLANNIGIPFRTVDAINYIENNNKEGKKKKKLLISKSICEEIYKDLSFEIKEINTILSKDEQIYLSTDSCSDTELETVFTKSDLDFLSKEFISNQEDYLLLNKKLSSYSLYSGLPTNFKVLDYILLNPDILRSNFDPVEHYLLHGKYEKRKYNFIKKLNIINLDLDGSITHLSIPRKILKIFILKLKLILHKFNLK